MVKTAAERQRIRREKLNADDTYQQYKVRNAQYSRVHRKKKKAAVKMLTREEYSKIAETR